LETVPVGNVGNAKDPNTGNAYGQVNYAYNIGKYEVTAGQYTEFLSAVAGVDTYSLYTMNMANINGSGCGITRSGGGTVGNPYIYVVDTNFINRPVNCVNFWDACRFANWLNNGQQGAGTTEYGAYTLNEVNPSNTSITRNTTGVTWAVSSEDEWYKAAYYNPATSSYYQYPTGSDTTPGRDLSDASGNNANFYGSPYPIQSPYYTTVAGEFQNSDSPYGTFDQGGDVSEWTEAILGGKYRGLRGGASNESDAWLLSSNSYDAFLPSNGIGYVGFRVVQLPEPASLGILGIGVVAMLVGRRARR
jgi:formylglycine-generating enzyme